MQLSREQLIAMSQSKSISAANKRQIAYSLLKDGHKDDAVAIFKDLAKDKGPDSQEVKDLLYLWGGKLNGEPACMGAAACGHARMRMTNNAGRTSSITWWMTTAS